MLLADLSSITSIVLNVDLCTPYSMNLLCIFSGTASLTYHSYSMDPNLKHSSVEDKSTLFGLDLNLEVFKGSAA
jgi:hypothetical protein